MVCVYCGSKTQVTNSRNQKRLKQVWRRRKCTKCSNLFTTIERIDFSSTLLIVDEADNIEVFVKVRLFLSIYESLGHRVDAIGDAAAITDTVMSNVLKTLKTPLIKRESIVSIAYEVLKKFDKPAAVHYLAYYPVKTKN